MEIILSHIQSDFDALAATVAASKLYPDAIPVLQDDLDPEVRALVATHKDALGLHDLAEIDPAAVRRVIVVDTRSAARLGDVYPALDRPEVDWVVYDHHPRAADELPAAPGRREAAGSATALIVEMLEQRKVAITPLEATVMALGIYADTGRLTFPGTTPADARAVAWLLAQGADLEVIAEHVEAELSAAQRALLEALMQRAEPRQVHGQMVLVVGARTEEYVGGVATVTQKLQALFDVDVIVVVAELGPTRTQFVGRSRLAAMDLRPVLSPWEPRGHPRAVSARARGVAFGPAVDAIWAAMAEAVPPEPRAYDLMSCPVRTIGPDASVLAARAALLDYGHNALVVLERGRVAGIVSRRDLDRAARHGLGEVAVRAVMTRRVITVAPDVALSAIEARFVEHDIGRLPVMHGEALVGIVTRQDVLRAKYDHHADRRAAVTRQTAELADRLVATWPADWLAVLDRMGEASDGVPVYLVGGAVRDLLLGRPNLDVDLVIEGDGIAYAKAAAARFPGAAIKLHAPFGTACITLPDGKKLDVATARTEHYERPAALPTVAFSTIKQDLARRDFSVNCLALRVDPGGRGELIDFFGARTDLARRELRALHNLSFVEDPTRVLRAVRFEYQLGFRLEPESEAFARYALATGAFDGIGGERNKVELRRLLALPRPVSAVRRLAELGALRLLAPDLTPDEALLGRTTRVWQRLALPGEEAWIGLLAALLAPLGPARAGEIVARLNLSGGDREAVVAALATAERLAALVREGPLAIVDALRPLGAAALAFLYAAATGPEERRAVASFWRDWRHIKLRVTGRDLERMGLPPGPAYAEILREVLAARLAGRIGPEQEEALLHEAADRHRKDPDAPC